MCHKSIYLSIYTIDEYLIDCIVNCPAINKGLQGSKEEIHMANEYVNTILPSCNQGNANLNSMRQLIPVQKIISDKDKTNPSKHLEEKTPSRAVSGIANQRIRDNSVEIPQNSKSESCQVT